MGQIRNGFVETKTAVINVERRIRFIEHCGIHLKGVTTFAIYIGQANRGTRTKISLKKYIAGEIRTLDSPSLKNWSENIYARKRHQFGT